MFDFFGLLSLILMALIFSRLFTKNIIAKVVTVRGLVDQAHVYFQVLTVMQKPPATHLDI